MMHGASCRAPFFTHFSFCKHSLKMIFLPSQTTFIILIIAVVCGVHLSSGQNRIQCLQRESQALLEFKAGLIDDDGILSSWKNGTDCCQWGGILCDNLTNSVVALDLSRVNRFPFLGGKMISPSLLQLDELNHLDLKSVDFSGSHIPDFIGSLGNLKYLNLASCNFEGVIPDSLQNLSMLEFLDLSNNRDSRSNLGWHHSGFPSLEYLNLSEINLNGASMWFQVVTNLPKVKEIHLRDCSLPSVLPPSLSPLALANISRSLSYIDLSVNINFTWGILDALKYCRSLSHLDLSFNNLTGYFPESFGNLTNLSYLDVSNNHIFLENIHNISANLRSLTYLDLSNNQLQGGIFNDLINVISLSHLDLSNNRLQNVSIPSTLGNLRSLSHLDLSQNELQGSIPSALGNLVSLSHLALSKNQLRGSIPSALGSLMSLSYLDLSDNQLQGIIPRSLGNLKSLSCLDLSNNQLQVEFLDEHLSSLTYLDLSQNKLEKDLTHLLVHLWNSTSLIRIDLSENSLFGSLPNMSRFQSLWELKLNGNQLNGSIGRVEFKLPNLEFLDLSKNKLNGRIPDLSSCLSLRRLYLNDNMFNGSLPESIGYLSNLVFLHIGSNHLDGLISEAHLFNLSRLYSLNMSLNSNLSLRINSSWNPPFQLGELVLRDCRLGPGFPKWLQNFRNLTYVDISNAKISDTIPDWFWGNTPKLEYLNMSYNDIPGALPDLSTKFIRLTALDLSFNQFTGTLPPMPPLSLNDINFSRNKFSGSIINLCKIGPISSLDVLDNLLSGRISADCFMNLTFTFYVNLANNNFSGSIEAHNTAGCGIHSLYLRNNSFTGYIPRFLASCGGMISLHLGENKFYGAIPGWLGESMPDLVVLNLKSNQLNGSVPSTLCHLMKIQVLDISVNNISGSIPNCINNFTLMSSKSNFNPSFLEIRSHLYRWTSFQDSAGIIWKGNLAEYRNTLWLVKVMDFASNNFSGEIPHEITTLEGLVALNLSMNNLIGSIPGDINRLELLNFLDLSQNKLSGKIPSTLSQLSHLGVLDLSYNNLSGKIPQGTHMDTFNASSYNGNPTLCGPPLVSRPCPEDVGMPTKPSSVDRAKKTEQENMLKTREFYISIILGFIPCFWGVFGTLYLSKRWNLAITKGFTVAEDWLYVKIHLNKRRVQRYSQNSNSPHE